MNNKFFSYRSIGLATYLGGPLAGGILISLNFKRLEEIQKGIWTVIISLLATIVLVIALIQIPEHIIDKIPSFLIPAVYTPIVVYLAKLLQDEKIRDAIKDKGRKEHWWKSLTIGLVGSVLTVIILMLVAFAEPPFPGDKITYGKIQNEIYFEPGSIDKEILDKVSFNLEVFGYFNSEFPQSAHVGKWETGYLISIWIDEMYWDDKELSDEFSRLKQNLSIDLNKEVTLILLSPDIIEIKEKRI
jgi:uncharacterized membrane protein YhaH (DUF805 family)